MALEDTMAPLPMSISEHFATLQDPRSAQGKDHLLVDILGQVESPGDTVGQFRR